MPSTSGRIRLATGRAILASGIWLAGLATSPAARADELTLPFGRWIVEARGFGWPGPLEALEVRESNRKGEPLLVGFGRDDDGQVRPWGSARVDRKATGPAASRWFTASWASGNATILIQVRPEP